MIDFRHSSYLNLHKNENVINKAIEYAKNFGTSFSGSPLICNANIYSELIDIITKEYSNKKVFIFPSGWQCNTGMISTLIKNFPKALIIGDKLNHNSIYNGIFLMPNCNFTRYQNVDLNHLEDILKQHINIQKIVVTESVFSMSGTILNMENFIFLKKKYNFLAYIDEAHATGVFGDNGYGLTEKYKDDIEIIMSTFSKALASQGGYTLINKDLSNIFERTSSFVYSTGLNPPAVGAAFAAFGLIKKMKKERQHIVNLINYYNKKTNNNHQSQIIPIIFDDINNAKTTHQKLSANNIMSSLVQYPTVLKPTIRICINCNHTKEDIESLVQHL